MWWSRATRTCAGVATLVTGTTLLQSSGWASTLESTQSEQEFGGRLIFLGTGSSSGVPKPFCMLANNIDTETCKVSLIQLFRKLILL